MRSRLLIPVAVLLAAAVAGGCAGSGAGAASPEAPKPDTTDDSQVDGLLVVDGERREGDVAATGEPPKSATDAAPAPASNMVLEVLADVVGDEDPWPAPPLLDDGTIDDGDDPFADRVLESQPLPVEDDPDTTLDIDTWATRLREIDKPTWDAWQQSGIDSPWTRRQDPTMASVVRIATERCGGAKTVATGVVVADETVVTTVHAIESIQRRVRVSPALGEPQFTPAMIRWLDVDDDVAVLKVPGLQMQPIDFYSGGGTTPQWGYTYGIARGTPSGAIRRQPAVIAVQEASISLEQPDGFSKRISDRSVFPLVSAVDTGGSGGLVTTTSDPTLQSGWALHGIVRARVPYRELTAGIVVPARIVQEAVASSQGLPPWFEHRAGTCPQWYR